MITRRLVLQTGAASLAAIATSREEHARAGAAGLTVGALNVPLGLQLWSLRQHLGQDVPGTLAKIRELGFTEVELAGLFKKTPGEFAGLLKKAGLTAQSCHLGLEKLRDDMPGVLKYAKTFGLKYVVCPWIGHKGKMTLENATGAIEVFNAAAKQLKVNGLKFAYHIHGYEYEPSAEGTLMDTIIKNTSPDVGFEVDVFWVTRGGGNVVDTMTKNAGRVPLMHLKDIAKGMNICQPNGGAPDETSVPLGAGMIDFPSIFRAAAKAGTAICYIEDEHPAALEQIPQSLAYLKSLPPIPAQ